MQTQKKSYKRKIRKVADTENTAIGKANDESESSIFRIERINRIFDKRNYLTTTVKINRTEKKLITDQDSPTLPAIKPTGIRIEKKTEIRKLKH